MLGGLLYDKLRGIGSAGEGKCTSAILTLKDVELSIQP